TILIARSLATCHCVREARRTSPARRRLRLAAGGSASLPAPDSPSDGIFRLARAQSGARRPTSVAHYPIPGVAPARDQVDQRGVAVADRGPLEVTAACQVSARLVRHRDGPWVEVEGVRIGEVDMLDVVYGPLITELYGRVPCAWPALIIGGRRLARGYRGSYRV